MNGSIPKVLYKSKNNNVEGIEIISIQDLAQRLDQLDHNPEKPHQTAFYIFAFYTNGNTKHLVDFVWHDVKKHSLIYLSKGQVNAFKFNKDVEGYIILFTETYFEKQLTKLPKDTIIRLFNTQLFSPKIQIPESSNVITYVELFYEEFYKANNSYNTSQIINYLYVIIFSKLEELKKHQTFHIKESVQFETFLKFKKLLNLNFQKSRNADFYARQLNITYKHLNIISKDIINQTAKQCIDDFIILEAKRQLINSVIKSTELAFYLGFEEATNFIKYFKKHTGLTPNQFKKLHK